MYFGHNEDDEDTKKTNPLVNLLTKKNLFIIGGIILGIIIIILVITLVKSNKNNNVYTFELVGPSEINVSLNDSYVDIGYIARDEDNNNIANLVNVSGNVDTTKVGAYKVVFVLTINDKNVTLERKVNVVKTDQLLTLMLNGSKNVTVRSNDIYEEEGYSAADSVEGDLNDIVQIANYIDYSTPGTYTIVYYVTNSKNITKAVYRTVNITN
mgnify:FL=1